MEHPRCFSEALYILRMGKVGGMGKGRAQCPNYEFEYEYEL